MGSGAFCRQSSSNIANHDWANATGLLIHGEETTAEKDMDEVLVEFSIEEGIDEGSDGCNKAFARLL